MNFKVSKFGNFLLRDAKRNRISFKMINTWKLISPVTTLFRVSNNPWKTLGETPENVATEADITENKWITLKLGARNLR